jgi:predicted small secreted protein
MHSIFKRSIAAFAAAVVLTGCNTVESQQPKSGGSAMHGASKPGTQTSAAANGHVWHMKKVEVKTTIGWDAIPQWNIPAKQQKQVVALTMLVPNDWQFNGGPKMVQPNDCNFTSGRLGFAATSPDKKSGIVSMPSTVSIWSTDRSILQFIQQDNQQYGRMQVCRIEQPQPLAQKIGQLVREFGKGVQPIGQMEPVPGVAEKMNASVQQANQQLAQQGSHLTVEIGRIRVQAADKNDDSDGYLTVMQVVRTDRLPNGATLSTIDYPMQVATFTPKGEYAAKDAMFAAMLDSVWVNPEYQTACLQSSANMQSIKQQMKSRISQIQAQMATDNLNAARQQAAIRQGVRDYSNQVHANVAAHRSAALEHSSQQFSMYMGDQALYHDPSTGQNVQLPSSYNHAWASTTGNTNEYILTDSPSFNPNGQVGSASWTPMQEVR